MIDLAELERLAAEATPGPWEALDTEGRERAVVPWVGITRPDGDIELIADCEQERGCQDAEFIAACDPPTVAALIQAVRASIAFRGELRLMGGGRRVVGLLADLDAALAVFGQAPA